MTKSPVVLDKRIILFEVNNGWMDGCKCEVRVCRLYLILGRAFVILGEVHSNKHLCTLLNSFQTHRLPISVLYALHMLLELIEFFDKHFFEWRFCYIIVYNSHLLYWFQCSKFKGKVLVSGAQSCSAFGKKGFTEKWITYTTTLVTFSCPEWHLFNSLKAEVAII